MAFWASRWCACALASRKPRIPASATAKLRDSVEQFVPDDEERRFVEPRLAHLLGLEDGSARGKEELFGAWRLFFERMAEHGTVTLLFEDLCRGPTPPSSRLIGHLLEWARQRPIFVFCLARPDLQGRHPEFGHGSHQTTLSLAPLGAGDAHAPRRLVPGLRGRAGAILARSEGVPLYAVETVWMLLDRGLLVEEEACTGHWRACRTLEVPETLHGLIAARLDGLAPEERRILQDAAVLGKTFAKESLVAVTGLPETDLDPLPSGLGEGGARRAGRPARPSADSTGSSSDLVRRVAYETLARRERKTRHLAAAAQLEATFGLAEQEIVEVVAAHYVAAYEAQLDADDAAGSEPGRASSSRAPGSGRLARRGGRSASALRAG